MALSYLLDENIPGRVWRAIQRHNESAENKLDVVRVGDSADLPFSSDDLPILHWTAREQRVLVTADKNTMPAHLDDFLNAGDHCPGIFMVKPGTSIPDLVEFLALAAELSGADEWRDRIEYIP